MNSIRLKKAINQQQGMNFLGHLYLSNNDQQLMLNNLFGDFVKGKDLSRFPIAVQKGIRLHRQIDDYIDRHQIVLKLLHELQVDLPKVAGIAIDLYFDHLLAKNWTKFHSVPLNYYLEQFYQHAKPTEEIYGNKFCDFIQKLIGYNWISHYPSLQGLEKACQGVSSRISFANELVHGKEVFLKHQEQIQESFEAYMKEAILKFNVVISK